MEIDKEVQAILHYQNEMSMAWVDQRAKRCCWIENPTGRSNDYFKYLDSFSYSKAKSVARISLRRPEYLEHTDQDGKQTWKLTNREKKELVELMNKPSEAYPGLNLTNWQATLIRYNYDNFYISPADTLNKTFDKQKYPKAYDIDYPMPDYTQL